MAQILTSAGRLWSDTRRRRIVYAVVALVLAILCVFPAPQVARVKLLPAMTSNDVSSLFGGAGAQGLAALLGVARAPTDLYLSMGRSDDVQKAVIKQLDLAGPGKRYPSVKRAQVALNRMVDVRSLLGGVIEVVVTSYDSELSQALAQGYTKAIANKIEGMAKEQIALQRKISSQKLGDAQMQVNRAADALRTFQQSNKLLLSPEAQFGAALSQRVEIESEIQAKTVALKALERSAGPENFELNNLQVQVATLRGQLARLASPATSQTGPNAEGMTVLSSRYLNLYRDYSLAQAIYAVYVRFAEQSALNELLSNEGRPIQLVEAAHLDAQRHYNLAAVGLVALLGILAFVTEVYGPATGVRIPGIAAHKTSDR